METVFLHLWGMRQKVEYLKTSYLVRAVVNAPLQTVEGANIDTDKMEEAHEALFSAMFPFSEHEKKKEDTDARGRLDHWVRKVKGIKVLEVLPDIKSAIKEHRARRRLQLRHTKRGRLARAVKRIL